MQLKQPIRGVVISLSISLLVITILYLFLRASNICPVTHWSVQRAPDNPWTLYDGMEAIVYSGAAFADLRGHGQPVVRLLGLWPLDRRCCFQCALWWRGRLSSLLPARCEYIKAMAQSDLRETFFDCPLLGQAEAVSLVPLHSTPDEWQAKGVPRIHIAFPKTTETASNLTICVSPTYGWNHVEGLKRFVSFYDQMGADHFYLYNYSWDAATDRQVARLRDAHRATVVDWPEFPAQFKLDGTPLQLRHWSAALQWSDARVHAYAQIVALNDCLLRNYHKGTKFVGFLDMDEFLWPQDGRAFTTLLSFLRRQDRPSIGSFEFRSVFLASTNQSQPEKLVDFRLTSKIFPFGVRTKVVVKPEAVLKVWIHYTWQLLRGYWVRRVRTDEYLILHLTADPERTKVMQWVSDHQQRSSLESFQRFYRSLAV